MAEFYYEFINGGCKCTFSRPNLIETNQIDSLFKIEIEPVNNDAGQELAIMVNDKQAEQIRAFLTNKIPTK